MPNVILRAEGPKDLEILRRLRRLRMTLSLLFFLSISNQVFADEKAYDFVIKEALVFNGESMEPVKQDIAITGDRIVQTGTIAPEEAKEVIEAEGLVAAPGFIDFHTHSDFNPFIYSNLGNKILQGVTTEVVGNCGMSAAPVTGDLASVWRREGVQIPTRLKWENFQEYRDESELQGLDTNFVGLVGHGNLRSYRLGMTPNKLSAEEKAQIKRDLREALKDGAFGVSFGLTYLPGIFAKKEELVEICHQAGLHNRLCIFHIRSESKNLLEALQEAIQIGKEANAPIHISHLKASGRNNWPKIKRAFQLIEKAQAEGQSITADVYPYTAGFAELGVILPNKFYQDPNRVARFQDLSKRGRLLRELLKYYEKSPVSWDAIKIATITGSKNFGLQGKSIQEIAKSKGKSPAEVLIELLAEEEFKVSAFYFSQTGSVVEQVLAKPYVVIGSDSIADGSAMPHPRAYGTFPKMLARCRKDKITQDLCWGNVINQMTARPAEILGLKDRGKIAPGAHADLVLFDPERIQDVADYTHPKTKPKGIEWVFVNGKLAVRSGKYEPVHAGLFLVPEK